MKWLEASQLTDQTFRKYGLHGCIEWAEFPESLGAKVKARVSPAVLLGFWSLRISIAAFAFTPFAPLEYHYILHLLCLQYAAGGNVLGLERF